MMSKFKAGFSLAKANKIFSSNTRATSSNSRKRKFNMCQQKRKWQIKLSRSTLKTKLPEQLPFMMTIDFFMSVCMAASSRPER